jgi:hypothetical protein
MFVTFAIGFLMGMGNLWGGDSGILYSSVMFLGHPSLAIARHFGLISGLNSNHLLELALHCLDLVLLTVVFYWI